MAVGARMLAAVLAAAALPASAHAATVPRASFEACPELARGARCGTVVAPRYPGERRGGTIRLSVVRVKPFSGRTRGAVIALSGGPGNAATRFAKDFATLLQPLLRSRELVLVDERGTGGSEALSCPSLAALGVGAGPDAAAACATHLGIRLRRRNTTTVSARDLDAVRKALGHRRIGLYGASYGTSLALRYAELFPKQVERLVLDSTPGPAGRDVLNASALRAMSRVLLDRCEAGRCAGVTDAVAADFGAVVRAARAGALRGIAVGADGVPRERTLDEGAIAGLLLTGDRSAVLRAALPAALRSAVLGDPQPLVRLATDASLPVGGGRVPVTVFSPARYAAVACSEASGPLRGSADPAARPGLLETAARALAGTDLGPFSPQAALATQTAKLCLGWPDTGRSARDPGKLPKVPTIVLAGDQDLSTPLEGAVAVHRRIAGSKLVVAQGRGHGVLAASACAKATVDAFVRGTLTTRRTTCPVPDDLPRPWTLAPLATSDDGPAVVAATVQDLRRRVALHTDLTQGAERGLVSGGLRGGRFAVQDDALLLDRVEVVPGRTVSGRIDPAGGVVEVSGIGSVAVPPGT